MATHLSAWAYAREDSAHSVMHRVPDVWEDQGTSGPQPFWRLWIPRVRALAELETNCAKMLPEDFPLVERVDMTFDSEKLAQEVQNLFKVLGGPGWGQYGGSAARGKWKTVQLVGKDGLMHPDTPGQPYAATEAWPHAGELIHSMLGPLLPALHRVRLSTVEPNDVIMWHDDRDATVRVRMHVPIFADGGAGIVIGPRAIVMAPGEVWVGDFDIPHHVVHHGSRPRTTLLVDIGGDEAILQKSELGRQLLKLQQRRAANPVREPLKAKFLKALDDYVEHFGGYSEPRRRLEYDYYCSHGSSFSFFASNESYTV